MGMAQYCRLVSLTSAGLPEPEPVLFPVTCISSPMTSDTTLLSWLQTVRPFRLSPRQTVLIFPGLGWPPFMDCLIGVVCQVSRDISLISWILLTLEQFVYVDRAYRLNNRNIIILLVGSALM